jgi:hypothetical protein
VGKTLLEVMGHCRGLCSRCSTVVTGRRGGRSKEVEMKTPARGSMLHSRAADDSIASGPSDGTRNQQPCLKPHPAMSPCSDSYLTNAVGVP